LLHELQILAKGFILLLGDNHESIHLMKNLAYHPRTKHIKIEQHFIRKKLKILIEVTYIKLNINDWIFQQSFSRGNFEKNKKNMWANKFLEIKKQFTWSSMVRCIVSLQYSCFSSLNFEQFILQHCSDFLIFHLSRPNNLGIKDHIYIYALVQEEIEVCSTWGMCYMFFSFHKQLFAWR
jgi:hypothetical protein